MVDGALEVELLWEEELEALLCEDELEDRLDELEDRLDDEEDEAVELGELDELVEELEAVETMQDVPPRVI